MTKLEFILENAIHLIDSLMAMSNAKDYIEYNTQLRQIDTKLLSPIMEAKTTAELRWRCEELISGQRKTYE